MNGRLPALTAGKKALCSGYSLWNSPKLHAKRYRAQRRKIRYMQHSVERNV